ncbi:MAG: hypothetical protein ACI30J_08995 [Paludibacteraceae bacterium]
MAKKKSLNDIISQSTRLRQQLRVSSRNIQRPANGWSVQQVQQMWEGKDPFSIMSGKIAKSTDTYANNILRSKQYQNAYKAKYEGEPINEREKRADNTKIPRNIYMGLANG